jgi:hypothetical protein
MREDSQFKLSNEDIRAIWPRLLAGEADYLIARDYGVTSAVITGIKLGDHWTHITKHLPGFPIVTDARAAAKRKPVRIPKRFANSPVEIWRPIPGHPEYRVSTFGMVETRWMQVRETGRTRYELGEDWNPVIPTSNKKGRPRFIIRIDTIKRKTMFVYVASLLAFAGPCPPGMICCHADDDPSNNHARNIRWDSHKANKADALRNAAQRLA